MLYIYYFVWSGNGGVGVGIIYLSVFAGFPSRMVTSGVEIRGLE